MLSDEERKIETLKKYINSQEQKMNDYYKIDEEFYKDEIEQLEFSIKLLRYILNLIEKQSKEIEELKEENKEIREWKCVIDNPIDLKKLSELDLIKIFGKSYISEDKIKAKIEELEIEQESNREDLKIAIDNLLFQNIDKIGNKISINMSVRGILQSLLEKE